MKKYFSGYCGLRGIWVTWFCQLIELGWVD